MKDQFDLIHNTNWDLLIILDACRYDYFADLCNIKGRLQKAISRATCTTQWLQATWPDFYEDIHYISANPYISSLTLKNGWKAPKHFGSIDKVWDWGWSDNFNTVPPKQVYNAIINYSGKRKVIAHFMQPHYPFIGRIYVSMNWGGERRRAMLAEGKRASETKTMEYEAALSEFGEKKVIEAYKSNLRLVLRWVKKIVKAVKDKKIVITADHGELLGNGGWGHPENGPEFLREVPWLEVKK